MSSWILVSFVTHQATRGTPRRFHQFSSCILFFFFLNFIGVYLQCCISFRCTVSESVIHINTSILFSHIGYYKLLSRFSCATQYVLINHLFYSVVCICYPHLSSSLLPATVSPMVTIRLVLKSVIFFGFINKFFRIIFIGFHI